MRRAGFEGKRHGHEFLNYIKGGGVPGATSTGGGASGGKVGAASVGGGGQH